MRIGSPAKLNGPLIVTKYLMENSRLLISLNKLKHKANGLLCLLEISSQFPLSLSGRQVIKSLDYAGAEPSTPKCSASNDDFRFMFL